uniref:Uncharacterized protein n=1 Tax=Percolomonas cosmopolitus TaxID=63605 RepID=A0A7S1KN16_9EUKA|mmetsp:Transcript_2371/g.8902  ORF Transcript_2371/g.8902 Transcript_2371/m.8902 type:complete len:986 (+) Transcript_2371:136-3093(+)
MPRPPSPSSKPSASLSLSTPDDIFGADPSNPSSKFTKLLYKDALKNADFRRIEFKETIRTLHTREHDIMVVFGNQVGKYFRSPKLNTHRHLFWKQRDDNLRNVIDNYIKYKDDHPEMTASNASLHHTKEKAMQYFRNIGEYSTEKVIENRKERDALMRRQKRIDDREASKRHIPKSERVEMKPYDYVEPHKRRPLVEFANVDREMHENDIVFFGGIRTSEQSPATLVRKRMGRVPSVQVEPPLTYRDHVNPTDDQLTHPLMTGLHASSGSTRRTTHVDGAGKTPGTPHDARPKSASAAVSNVRRQSILKTSPSFQLSPRPQSAVGRVASQRSISFSQSGSHQAPSPSSAVSSPSARATSTSIASTSPRARTQKRPRSMNHNPTQRPSQRPHSAAPSRVELKEPISEDIIERVATARLHHQPSRNIAQIWNHRQTSPLRRRTSIFLTELEKEPSRVRITDSVRLHTSGGMPGKHSNAKPENQRNSSSKTTLLSSLKRKNIPRGKMRFPSEELKESNLRIKTAKSGKVFVNQLVKLPNLHILFPEIAMKNKRTLRSGIRSLVNANILAKSFSTKTPENSSAPNAGGSGDDDDPPELSTFRSFRNKELIEKYTAECLELDRDMKAQNQEIFDLCEDKRQGQGGMSSLSTPIMTPRSMADSDADYVRNHSVTAADEDDELTTAEEENKDDGIDTLISRRGGARQADDSSPASPTGREDGTGVDELDQSPTPKTTKNAPPAPSSSSSQAHRKITDINPAYWKLQFGATQMQSQTKLLNELDQRYMDRRAVYQSRQHLEKVVKKSIKSAEAWSMSRSSAKGGQLWKNAKLSLHNAEHELHQAAMFYSMLRDFCFTNHFPETEAQKAFVDRVRNMLIRAFQTQQQYFLTQDILFGNVRVNLLQDRKSIKLVHWIRSTLNVSMRPFFEFLEEQGWMENVHTDLQKMQSEVKKQNSTASLLLSPSVLSGGESPVTPKSGGRKSWTSRRKSSLGM